MQLLQLVEQKGYKWNEQHMPAFTTAKLIPTTFGHYYANPQGIRYTSVTTMFSKLMPFMKSPIYPIWMASLQRKFDVEYAGAQIIGKYISKMAMLNGTTVHGLIEEYLNNKTHKGIVPLLPKAHFQNILPLLHNIDNIQATEIPLYSDSMKLAGTADCIAEYNNTLSIIDFKTSNHKKYESDIENYFLQATAYAEMYGELTGKKIEQIAILITCNSGHLQSFVKNPADYKELLLEKIKQFELMGGYSS